ncbi:MAG: Type 1 glutamine amidotransferase-like domain-containing protein [Propionibacteriaceae bacterium]|jgi:peptidase E|nr:Type 1 glutamine amidotransferase-like domain-containing protein [Propionibacteriaceae bacterium]
MARRLLLTSAGLQGEVVAQAFLSLIPKPAGELRVLFVPTASRTEGELFFVRKSFDELLGVGVRPENISRFDADDPSTHLRRADVDCVYVCGGNTFYLLHKLKQVGFFTTLGRWIDDGLFYVGVSAGSIITTPDIGYIGDSNANDVGLRDTRGLALIPSCVAVHFSAESQPLVDRWRASGLDVVTLGDDQALVVRGDQISRVG